jgi:hypothetical protein
MASAGRQDFASRPPPALLRRAGGACLRRLRASTMIQHGVAYGDQVKTA